MRICLFTPTFLPLIGGAEHNADLLARGLVKRGHEVMVLAQRPRGPFTEPTLPYPVRRFGRLPLQHWWPETLAWTLRRAHRAWPFTVCLAFYSYPTGYAAGLVKKQLKFGLVISPRGSDLHEGYHMLSRPRVNAVIRKGYRRADRIAAISQWMVERLRIVAGPDLPPTEVIYNGIDLAEVDRQVEASRTAPPATPLIEKPFILHMASIKPIKNQRLVIEALGMLRDEMLAKGVSYAFVGDGPSQLELRRRAQELRLDDIVKFPGVRGGAEKTWLLANADFFVTSSREEALGTVVVEAMAHGLPILASDIPPHRELIEGRGWGTLFRSGDVTDLAAKMRQMLNADLSPYRRAAMEQRNRFTLEEMIDRYEAACLAVEGGA